MHPHNHQVRTVFKECVGQCERKFAHNEIGFHNILPPLTPTVIKILSHCLALDRTFIEIGMSRICLIFRTRKTISHSFTPGISFRQTIPHSLATSMAIVLTAFTSSSVASDPGRIAFAKCHPTCFGTSVAMREAHMVKTVSIWLVTDVSPYVIPYATVLTNQPAQDQH